jgi:SNF2 family DNA or RNA helicase
MHETGQRRHGGSILFRNPRKNFWIKILETNQGARYNVHKAEYTIGAVQRTQTNTSPLQQLKAARKGVKSLLHIKNGDIVRGPHWPEPVEVKLAEEVGDYIRLVGMSLHSHQHIDQLVQRSEIEALNIAKLELDFTAEAAHAFLSLEARRYRYASLYDPLLAMHTAKVDPLPHQVEAVYGYVLKLPRIRFLIADDPGAGKTIMAGLIIKELKLRQLVNRILIVVPGHLRDQWRRELKERFEESFVVVDRGLLEAFYGENIWQREKQIITSLDFAKREDVLPSLSSAQFDLVIVDEAHKMSAYRYGEKIDRTGRYKLGEVLSKITEHLLFLTATPHKGDPENFRLFLDLLEPGFFATGEMLLESIASKDNPLFIRRVKEDLKDFEGKPLFLPRHVKTINFNLGTGSPAEKELYNELSRYVNTQYNKALSRDKKRNVAFALVILQRRLASSTYALLKSIERRKKRLTELLTGAQERAGADERLFDFEVIADLRESEAWKIEEIWETLSVAENKEELVKEIDTLEGLALKARKIIEREEEIKLRELKKTISELNKEFPGEKILIFTESRDTLEYLRKRIESWGFSVSIIHGGMDLEERVKAEGIFKNETRVMAATEAAGEGINLQFCHLMINYDIPWNPNRLEQRMGRVHRYGQNKEVFVFNLVAEDTREGKVFKKLFEKLEAIKEALGSEKVFDVLSEVLYGKNLSQLLLEAAANARNIDEILKEIDIQVDDEYIARVKDNLGESLATRYIDYTRLKEMTERAREYRLIPEYTEAFFKKTFALGEGKFKERKDAFLAIESVPFDFRRIAGEDSFRKKFGALLKAYPKATFDKEKAFKNPDAEFISFGHPLFEACLSWVERTLSASLKKGAVFEDPAGKLDGVVLFYEGEIKDGRGNVAGKRLFAFYVDGRTEEIKAINPAFIWDLAEGKPVQDKPVDAEMLKSKVRLHLLPVLENYRVELARERERQSAIKEKYGIMSLEHLIVKLDGDLIDLYDRRDRGENVDLAIRNKEEQKKKYEIALAELKQTIRQERILTMNTPVFLGAIKVLPAATGDPAMESDEEIEKIGMEVAIRYEREQGRDPQDVSGENPGFDLRSTSSEGERRYIEVKARAGTGAVALTQNEWFKAKRFKDEYFLYVILNAATRPELIIVQNPAEELQFKEHVEIVRYFVSREEITEKGVKVT